MKFKEFMKNLFTKNVLLKLVAIGFAFIISIVLGAAA